MKSVIAQGSTVVKAIEEALKKADMPKEFFVKLLEDAQSGFLGFGSKKAKIALFFKDATVTSSKSQENVFDIASYSKLFNNPAMRKQIDQQLHEMGLEIKPIKTEQKVVEQKQSQQRSDQRRPVAPRPVQQRPVESKPAPTKMNVRPIIPRVKTEQINPNQSQEGVTSEQGANQSFDQRDGTGQHRSQNYRRNNRRPRYYRSNNRRSNDQQQDGKQDDTKSDIHD